MRTHSATKKYTRVFAEGGAVGWTRAFRAAKKLPRLAQADPMRAYVARRREVSARSVRIVNQLEIAFNLLPNHEGAAAADAGPR